MDLDTGALPLFLGVVDTATGDPTHLPHCTKILRMGAGRFTKRLRAPSVGSEVPHVGVYW